MADDAGGSEPTYFRVLRRFSSFGTWPESTSVAGPTFLARNTAEESWGITIYVRTHLRSESTPADKPVGPLIWAGTVKGGYVIGNRLVHDRGTSEQISMVFENAEPNEIDIIAFVVPDCDSDARRILDEVAPLLDTIAAYINASTGELLVPVAPAQIQQRRAGGEGRIEAFTELIVRDRPTLTQKRIETLLSEYAEWQVTETVEKATSAAFAARRHLASLRETDIVDRFCDLWEVCEFASRGVRAKGGLVGRIAQMLSTHSGHSKAAFEKRFLRQAFAVRNDLVHNALEEGSRMRETINALEAAAEESIRAVLGLPYDPSSSQLEKLMTEP